jgi:sec-independent protein translocase protein TatB
MFDISFSELTIIGVVALVVIGPERLPKVARTAGHLVGRAQRYVSDVKADIQREVELDEIRNLKQTVDNAASEMRASLQETETSLRDASRSLQADLDATAAQAKSAIEPLTAPAAAEATPAIAKAAPTPEPAPAPGPVAEASKTPAPPPPAGTTTGTTT